MRSVFIISDLMDFVNIFIKKTINYTPYAIKMMYFENTHRVRIKTVKNKYAATAYAVTAYFLWFTKSDFMTPMHPLRTFRLVSAFSPSRLPFP